MCSLLKPIKKLPKSLQRRWVDHGWEEGSPPSLAHVKDFQFLRSTSDLNVISALAASGKSSVTRWLWERKFQLGQRIPDITTHNTHTELLELMSRNKTDATRTSKLTATLGGARISPPVVYFPLFEAQTYFPGFWEPMILHIVQRWERCKQNKLGKVLSESWQAV